MTQAFAERLANAGREENAEEVQHHKIISYGGGSPIDEDVCNIISYWEVICDVMGHFLSHRSRFGSKTDHNVVHTR